MHIDDYSSYWSNIRRMVLSTKFEQEYSQSIKCTVAIRQLCIFFCHRNLLDEDHPKIISKNKGFTLVELCITVATLSVLAAITFPIYSGLRERASAFTLISSMNNFSKECLINTLSGNASQLDIPDSITLTSISGAECAAGATIKNATPFDGSQVTGIKCGSDIQENSTEVICTFTISPDGELSSSWNAQ